MLINLTVLGSILLQDNLFSLFNWTKTNCLTQFTRWKNGSSNYFNGKDLVDEQSVHGKNCGGHVGLGNNVTVFYVNSSIKVQVQKKTGASDSELNNIAKQLGLEVRSTKIIFGLPVLIFQEHNKIPRSLLSKTT